MITQELLNNINKDLPGESRITLLKRGSQTWINARSIEGETELLAEVNPLNQLRRAVLWVYESTGESMFRHAMLEKD
jgi:hypothetical protein